MRHIARLGLVMLAALAFGSASGQPLTTNFDDITTLPGAGWVLTNNSVAAGSVPWFQGNTAVFTSQAGAANSYLAANFNAAAFTGNISLWALTPNLTNLRNGEVLTFFTRTETGAPAADRLEVRLSTNGASSNVGATDTTVGDFTTVLTTVNPTLTVAGYPNVWTMVQVTLSGLPPGATSGRIGFRYFVTDTSTNADYIGIDSLTLSAPPPDMTITKSHVGNFTQGQVGATYTITATNSGASPTVGTVTVTDTVPVGLTPTAAAGTGWVCGIAAQVVTCTRSDVLAATTSYPPITLTVTVSGMPPASVTNTATVAGGGEVDATNDSASDPTTINPVGGAPDLTIAKSHSGNFTQGQAGATYSVTVSNSGAAPTSGTVTMTDTLPAGLTPTAASGTGWVCSVAAQLVTCTRSDALAAAGSYPVVTLTVTVSASAPASVTNTATVSGGGETNVGNDSASDPTTINATGVPDLTITSTHSGSFAPGSSSGIFSLTVSNVGGAPTVGTVTVVDTPSAGLTVTSISGTGWACVLATRTCTRSDVLAAGSSYPVITVAVSVASNAPSTVSNSATVSGGGETNVSNDTGNDIVTAAATIVPTLSPAMLLVMSLLLGLMALFASRRRRD